MDVKINRIKMILTVIAVLEGLTGLVLVTVPSFVVTTLFRSSLTDPVGSLLGRLAGGILIGLALACWFLRESAHASTMVRIMVGYNTFTILLLVYAALVEELIGFGMWPTVLLHAGLLVWCLASLLTRVPAKSESSKETRGI